MSKRRSEPRIKRSHRLLYLYLFRDFDMRTLDAGLEYTVLSPQMNGVVLCHGMTVNLKGVRRHNFVVQESSRRILNLAGRYVCYWTRGHRKEWIYGRPYVKEGNRTYVHSSTAARSTLRYDSDWIEKAAENLVSHPRRYHEKFTRLLRF